MMRNNTLCLLGFLSLLYLFYLKNNIFISVSIDFTDVLCCADKISDVLVKYTERLTPHLPNQVFFFFSYFCLLEYAAVTKLNRNMN